MNTKQKKKKREHLVAMSSKAGRVTQTGVEIVVGRLPLLPGQGMPRVALTPDMQMRLLCYAKTNKKSLPEMVELALRFALALDGEGPELIAPDESDLIEFAANLAFSR